VKMEAIRRKWENFGEFIFSSRKNDAVDVIRIVEYTDLDRKCVFIGARKNWI